MNEDVLPLLFSLTSKKSILSKDDIYKLLSDFIERNSLTDYCKNIEFDEKEWTRYDFFLTKLNINYEEILEYVNQIAFATHSFSISKDELIINYLIIFYIMHEYFHVVEQKLIEEYLNQEGILLNKTITFSRDPKKYNSILLLVSQIAVVNTQEKYSCWHDNFYQEYHADVNAYFTFIDAMNKKSNLNDEEKLKLKFMNFIAARFLYKHYSFVNQTIIHPKSSFYNLVVKSLALDSSTDKYIKNICNTRSSNISELDNILCGDIISEDTFFSIRDIFLKKNLTLNLFKGI